MELEWNSSWHNRDEWVLLRSHSAVNQSIRMARFADRIRSCQDTDLDLTNQDITDSDCSFIADALAVRSFRFGVLLFVLLSYPPHPPPR